MLQVRRQRHQHGQHIRQPQVVPARHGRMSGPVHAHALFSRLASPGLPPGPRCLPAHKGVCHSHLAPFLPSVGATSGEVAAPLHEYSISFDSSTVPASLLLSTPRRGGSPPPPQQRMLTEAHNEPRFLDACWRTLCCACASRLLPSPLTAATLPLDSQLPPKASASLPSPCWSSSWVSSGSSPRASFYVGVTSLCGHPQQRYHGRPSGERNPVRSASAAGALSAFGGPPLPQAQVGRKRHCETPLRRTRQALTNGVFLFFAFSLPTPLRLPLRSIWSSLPLPQTTSRSAVPPPHI